MCTYSKKQHFLPHQYGQTLSRVSSRRQQLLRLLHLADLRPVFSSLFRNRGSYAQAAADLGSAILGLFLF